MVVIIIICFLSMTAFFPALDSNTRTFRTEYVFQNLNLQTTFYFSLLLALSLLLRLQHMSAVTSMLVWGKEA